MSRVRIKERLLASPPLLGGLLAALLTAGCTVGPDYVAPLPKDLLDDDAETFASTEVPAVDEVMHGGKHPGGTGEVEAAPPPDADWWRAVGDPMLAELVTHAVTHNLDLDVATARVRRARAARRAVAADGKPQVGSRAFAERSRASENTPEGAFAGAGLTDLEVDRFGLGLSASWEIDVFGGVRRATEAADAVVAEAIEGRRGIMLGVIAEVARTYSELRGAQRRLALAKKNAELQEETHRRVSDLARVGLGSKLDVERVAALWAGTRARLPPLRAQIRAAAHRLAVLTGRPPAALLDRLLAAKPLTDPPDLVPVGLPSDLLRRRPDVRAAERRLAASSAEIGVATANLYPRFFLTGSGGLESRRFADLFETASRTFRLGPSISWPVFQGGRIRAGIAVAEAEHDARRAELRHAVLRAVEDVESALVAYAEEELRRRQLASAAASSARAVELARVVYEKGLESFLTVLDAERSLVEVEDQLAQSETGLLLRLTALYAALGGGWETAEASPAP